MSEKAGKKSAGGVPSLFASTISDTDKLGKRRFTSSHKYVQKDIDLGSVVRSDLKDKLSSRISGAGNRQTNNNGRKKGGLDIFALMDSAMETGPTEEAKQRARDEAAAQKAKEEAPILPKPKKVVKKKAKSFNPAKSSEVPALFASGNNDSSSTTREPAWKSRMKDRLAENSSKAAAEDSIKEEEEVQPESKHDTMTSIPEDTEVKRGVARKQSGSMDILEAIDSAMETGPTEEAKEKAKEEAAAKKATEAFVSPRKVVKKKAKSFSPASPSPGGVPTLFSSRVGSPSGANREPAWKVRLRESQNKEMATTTEDPGQPSALDKALNEIEQPQVNDKPQIAKTANKVEEPQSHKKDDNVEKPHIDRKADKAEVEEPHIGRKADKVDEPQIDKTPTKDHVAAVDKVPDSTVPSKPEGKGKTDDDDEFSVSISDVDTDTDDDEEAPEKAEPPAKPLPVTQATASSNTKKNSEGASPVSPAPSSTGHSSPTKTTVTMVQNNNFAAKSPTLSTSPIKSPESVVQRSLPSKVQSPQRSLPRNDIGDASNSSAALSSSGKTHEVESTKAESPKVSPRKETPPDKPAGTPLASSYNSFSKSSNSVSSDPPAPDHAQQASHAPTASATSKFHRSRSSLDDSDSDSSDDAEANYPSAFKFTAKPTTTFYRISDSDDSSSSDDSDVRGGFQFGSGDDGGISGLPSADFEFLIDDDTETKQFIFSLKDELVSHHSADWYTEKITEAEKRLQISVANYKVQQAELKKLVDRKKEAIADVFEVKMDSHRRMGAKQSKSFQKAYEEEQKIVETLRKENKRVRAELNKLPKQIKETNESIKNLEAANTEIDGHLESLGKFSKKLERDHEKLQESSAQCRDVYLPRYRNELRHREFEIDVETRIKNLYRNCCLKISKYIGARKPELQEAVNEVFLETEADVNPKFNPKILFEGDSDSDSSSSDSDSDSSSSSSDSDSD